MVLSGALTNASNIPAAEPGAVPNHAKVVIILLTVYPQIFLDSTNLPYSRQVSQDRDLIHWLWQLLQCGIHCVPIYNNCKNIKQAEGAKAHTHKLQKN